jgi:hypothetical protein
MSGCANCVWDLFRDDLEEWAAKSKEARVRMQAARRAGDGRESGAEWKGMEESGEGRDLFEGIPVGIREFMKIEKKLKERHAREKMEGT